MVFALAAFASARPALADTLKPPPDKVKHCVKVSQLVAPAMFRRYAAPVLRHEAALRAPDVRAGQAHLFRTALRSEGGGPPDFAGSYKVVRLGCGTGNVCPAFVERTTGRVLFPRALRSVFILPGSTDKAGGYDRLAFRADSELLATLGTRNEDMPAGVSLFRWNRGKPHLIRFVPESQLCRVGWDYQ